MVKVQKKARGEKVEKSENGERKRQGSEKDDLEEVLCL